MKFRNNATAHLPEAYQEWYVNPYLDTEFRLGMDGKNPTYPEYRIHLLYNLLKQNNNMSTVPVMPWMWDHENYMDDNKDMYGYFYPEDFHNILEIRSLESRRKEKK